MRVRVFAVLLMLFAVTLRAQTIETPIAFDSAHRVFAITPGMAERLALQSPAWLVSGEFREVRLYSVSPGDGYTLVVHRPSGTFERFALSLSERTTLGNAIDAAMSVAGRPSAEIAADMVSEPAGNAFARRLTILSAIAYGPLAASLADNGPGAGALYLLTTGLTYFVSYGAAQSNKFTRAQSDLAGDLGLAGGGAGLLLGYAATGEGGKAVRATGLGGALIGTVAGASLAKRYSDAEAHGAIMGVEAGAAAGVAAASLANADGRSVAFASVLGGAVGYPVGVWYPRHAGYSLTAGDVEAIGTSALIGSLWAAATLGTDPGAARVGATLGLGYLGGAFVGERVIARSFNLTQTQANVLKVGALAGGLIGLAIPTLADEQSLPLQAVTAAGGATLGMAALAASFPRSTRVGSSLRSTRQVGSFGVSISPASAFAAATGVAGRHSLVRLSF